MISAVSTTSMPDRLRSNQESTVSGNMILCSSSFSAVTLKFAVWGMKFLIPLSTEGDEETFIVRIEPCVKFLGKAGTQDGEHLVTRSVAAQHRDVQQVGILPRVTRVTCSNQQSRFCNFILNSQRCEALAISMACHRTQGILAQPNLLTLSFNVQPAPPPT